MRSEQKYSLAMRSLHWLVFLAVTIAVVAIEIHDFFPKAAPRAPRHLRFIRPRGCPCSR